MKVKLKLILALTVVLSPVASSAGERTLSELLRKGPIVLVEDTPTGRYSQSTAVIEIDAPPERVWATLLAMDEFREFMPRVITSEVTRSNEEPDQFDVRLVYDLPGPDTEYTARMVVDRKARKIEGTWLKDDLKGSWWSWELEPLPDGRTLLLHNLCVKNFSPLLQQVDDDQETVTIGVNISSALVTVKALKRRAESVEGQARR